MPIDIILTIIEHIPLPPEIGLAKWDKEYTNVLLINRAIYSAAIARVYHTVILCTSKILKGFLGTLNSSPHLGPLVRNLWMSHEAKIAKRSRGTNLDERYSVTTNVLAIVALTPNLRRLAIASPLYYRTAHLSNTLPVDIVDLVIPSLWLGSTPNAMGKSILSRLPTSLRALHVRGRVGAEEARAIVDRSPTLHYVYVRVFGSVVLEDLERFTLVLIVGLKDMRSLELTVLPNQEVDVLAYLSGMGDKHTEVDAKVSVRVNDDGGENELQSWLACDDANGPAWAAVVKT
ncbi:hypothetical protein CTheo_1213 [Ceratobasidium theobromae]|uniref:F-box domain-containing protein n=1 Tax=Ceratobasidium theobromae TaxID=1582974 RepID=A0A5N5QUT8_9AGAM|nr:hypothetical protein CTheo_1213 [Ceratobasidium theobromae]